MSEMVVVCLFLKYLTDPLEGVSLSSGPRVEFPPLLSLPSTTTTSYHARTGHYSLRWALGAVDAEAKKAKKPMPLIDIKGLVCDSLSNTELDTPPTPAGLSLSTEMGPCTRFVRRRRIRIVHRGRHNGRCVGWGVADGDAASQGPVVEVGNASYSDA